MGVWGKATNYEIGTHVLLILQAPDVKNAGGKKTEALVELVDMYPTLCDLAGLPIPSHLEGVSLVPILDHPEGKVKDFAISQYPNPGLREWAANPLAPAMRETFFGPLIAEVEARIMKQQGEKWDRDFFENHLMGYALRNDRLFNEYYLLAWLIHEAAKQRGLVGSLKELKDHPMLTRDEITILA